MKGTGAKVPLFLLWTEGHLNEFGAPKTYKDNTHGSVVYKEGPGFTLPKQVGEAKRLGL